jgi:hypothetical protein
LGGYDTALKLAKQAARIPESDEVKIVVYPQPKGFVQSFIQLNSPENSDKEAVGQTLVRILQDVQPVARQLDAAGVKTKGRDQDDVLRMSVPSTQ